MPKRKSFDDIVNDDSVPLPIQTYFWRQIGPFIRPKYGKEVDANLMEQREAGKLFEKVLVQNIQFGLSPGFTEALKTISRWQLIQAALPHIIHCCSSMLYARKETSMEKLGASETKLLYTLHWMILDAAEECADAETDKGIIRPMGHYLFTVTTIQVFIYLFIPLLYSLKQSDFLSSFRLENGLKLWKPLWEFRHPGVGCFCSYVKPKRTILTAKKEGKVPKFGDVFIGADNKKKENKDFFDLIDFQDGDLTSKKMRKESLIDFETKEVVCSACQLTIKIPRTETSAICSCGQKVSLESKCLQKIQPFDSYCSVRMATFLDVAVLRCLFTSQWLEEGVFWAMQFLYNRLQEVAKDETEDTEPRKRSASLPIPKIEVTFHQPVDSIKKTDIQIGISPAVSMRSVAFEPSILPFSHHSSMQELRQFAVDGQPDKHKPKRLKIGDFKAFVEEKFRFSERHLDKIGQDRNFGSANGDSSGNTDLDEKSSSIKVELDTKEAAFLSDNGGIQTPPRPMSALGFFEPIEKVGEKKGFNNGIELLRGKSMPSLHLLSYAQNDALQDLSDFPKKVPAHHTQSFPNPIITVTEHSPVTSMQFFMNPVSKRYYLLSSC